MCKIFGQICSPCPPYFNVGTLNVCASSISSSPTNIEIGGVRGVLYGNFLTLKTCTIHIPVRVKGSDHTCVKITMAPISCSNTHEEIINFDSNDTKSLCNIPKMIQAMLNSALIFRVQFWPIYFAHDCLSVVLIYAEFCSL